MGCCMSYQEVFKVFTVHYKEATIEVTDKFILYVDNVKSELWPLHSVYKYGYDGCCFSFEESSENYPGTVKHQFYVQKAHVLFDSVAKKKDIPSSLAWERPDTYPVMKTREGKGRRLATSTNHSKRVTTREEVVPVAAKRRGMADPRFTLAKRWGLATSTDSNVKCAPLHAKWRDLTVTHSQLEHIFGWLQRGKTPFTRFCCRIILVGRMCYPLLLSLQPGARTAAEGKVNGENVCQKCYDMICHICRLTGYKLGTQLATGKTAPRSNRCSRQELSQYSQLTSDKIY